MSPVESLFATPLFRHDHTGSGNNHLMIARVKSFSNFSSVPSDKKSLDKTIGDDLSMPDESSLAEVNSIR
jgi:hypothetical protein